MRNQDWIDAWTEGFLSMSGRNVPADAEHLAMPHLLEVTAAGDAIFLLNPLVVSAAGEWQAWDFANWHPGAFRYPSLWELTRVGSVRWLAMRSGDAACGPRSRNGLSVRQPE